MNSHFVALIAITMLSLLCTTTACTVDKKDPIQTHVGPPPETGTNKQKETEYKLGNLDLAVLYEKAKLPTTNIMDEILLPIYRELFKPSRLTSPILQAERQTQWALQFFNENIIKSKNDKKMPGLLAQYRKFLTSGCANNGLKDCDNFFFFKKDPNTVAVIKILLQHTSDVREFFRLTYIAFEISNRQPDDELTRLAFSRTMDLLRTFVKVQRTKSGELHLSTSHLSKPEAQIFRLHLTVIGLLASTSATEAKISGLKSSASELMAWMASPQFVEILGNNLAAELNDLVSDWLKSPEVWNGLHSEIKNFESRDDNSYTVSLSKIPQKMLNGLKVQIIKLNELKPRSLIGFYFISRILGLKPLSQELYLWQISEKNPKETAEFIQATIKMQLLANIHRTNVLMADYFKRLQTEQRAKNDLFKLTINKANENIVPIWADFFARTSRLEAFFASYLEQPYKDSTDEQTAQAIADTRRMFTELNANVKYMATYPNMIMFGYFATIFDYSETFALPEGGTITVDKDLFLSNLLDGKVGPMFILTSYKSRENQLNFRSLDKIETMWSFNYLIQEDLLSLYDVKMSDFLSVFFRKYKDPNDIRLREWIKRLDALTRQDSRISLTFEVCAAFDTKNQATNKLEFGMPAKEILNYTLLGEPGSNLGGEPLLTAASQLRNAARLGEFNLDEAVEIIRSDINPKLRILDLIKIMIGKQPSSVDQKNAMAEIEAQLKETQELKQVVLTRVEALSAQARQCFTQLGQLELQRQLQMVSMELKYAEDIFALLEILNELNKSKSYSDQTTLAELKLKFPQNILFTSAKYQSLIGNVPILEALNIWLAERVNLTDILRINASYKTEFKQDAGLKRDRDGRFYYNSRTRDFAFRATSYLRFGYDGAVISPKPEQTKIFYPNTAKQLNEIGFSGNDPVVAVYSNGNLESFQKSFMSLLKSRTMWLRNERIFGNYGRYMEKDQAAIHKMKFEAEMDLQKIADCTEECIKREVDEMKTASQQFFIDSNERIQRLSLDADKIALLNWFDTDSYFSFGSNPSMFGRGPVALFISTDGEDDYLGSADDYFTFVSSKNLGYNSQFWQLRAAAESEFRVPTAGNGNENLTAKDLIQRPDVFADALESATTLREQDQRLLFPIDGAIIKAIQVSNTYLVQREMLLAHSFEVAAREWESTGQPILPMQFSTLKPRLERPAVLSENLISNYLSIMRRFNDQTAGAFLPTILKEDARWFSGK